MSSEYSHDQVLQSIQPNRKKYKAISLSTAITMELEDLMEQKGISKKELAAAAGVSPSYLSQVFSGDKLINISMLAGISNEFNVVFRMEINANQEIDNLKAQIAKLQADNRSLVEQMNEMALKQNQED